MNVENEALRAEVELYRSEAQAFRSMVEEGNSSSSTTGLSHQQSSTRDHFVRGGDGVYAKETNQVLNNCHGASNVLCCSLSIDDAILATGGADKRLNLEFWNSETKDDDAVKTKVTIDCGAPVIAVDFSRHGRTSKFVAAGCMDGSVKVVWCEQQREDGGLVAELLGDATITIQHNKYVKCVSWSSTENLLASASADGTILLHKLEWNLVDPSSATLQLVQTLHLNGAIESTCFRGDHLCCYARGSPYIHCFDTAKNFEDSKSIHLNKGSSATFFDDHVSFAIMGMESSADNKYLACATDSSRNMVLDWRSQSVVRNLYGHKNDSYSQPKLGWSFSGSYIYGNTQEENAVCVWDIASSQIVDKLEGGHSNIVRDLYSSSNSDTLVTTSFDKTTRFWKPAQNEE